MKSVNVGIRSSLLKFAILTATALTLIHAQPLLASEGHIIKGDTWHEVVSGDEIRIHVHVQDDVNEFWADEYRIYIYNANGNEVEHEPDTYWKNLDGESYWFTASSDLDAAWDIFDLGSSYTIKFYEQSNGFQDSQVISNSECRVCSIPTNGISLN